MKNITKKIMTVLPRYHGACVLWLLSHSQYASADAHD